MFLLLLSTHPPAGTCTGPSGLAAFGSVSVGGTPATPRGGGGGPRAALPLSCGPLLACPLLSGAPSRPFFRRVAKWGRLLFGVAGGFLSLSHPNTTVCSQSLSLSLFLPSLRLWIGPKKLQKCNESENLRSG